MKELQLYRHAKAKKASPGMMDRERQLSGEGELQARYIGGLLHDLDFLPDVVLASTAARALSTAKITMHASACKARIVELPHLFDAEVDTYVESIRNNGGESDRIMVVGHNPVIEEFVERLIGRHIELKTGYLARVLIDIAEWKSFTLDGAPAFELAALLVPPR